MSISKSDRSSERNLESPISIQNEKLSPSHSPGDFNEIDLNSNQKKSREYDEDVPYYEKRRHRNMETKKGAGQSDTTNRQSPNPDIQGETVGLYTCFYHPPLFFSHYQLNKFFKFRNNFRHSATIEW